MKKIILSLFVLIFIFPSFLRLADYEARENDSRLYTKFVQQLGEKPISHLIALEWKNLSVYADKENPYVRDHLIGQFIPSVFLYKMGWDGRYTHYLVNQVYRFFIPLLMYFFLASYFRKEEVLFVIIAMQINSVSLNYGLRANQEQALLFSLIITMASFLTLKTKKDTVSFFAMGGFGFLVKGLVGLIQYPFWVIHSFTSPRRDLLKKRFLYLVGLGGSCLVIATIYEIWFSNVTGFSFWEAYFRIQVFGRRGSGGIPFSSLPYYFSRTLGYSLPWGLGLFFMWFKRKELSVEQRDLSQFLLWNIFGYLLIFGYFSRNASRYIFPVYYLLSSLGAVGLGMKFEKISQKVLKRIDPITLHLIIFWSLLIIQYALFLYKGKTFDNR